MWSDEELDREFRRLAPPDADEPAPHEQVPFPLDSWLDLERQLDTDATKRLVRRRMWQLVGAETLALLLALLVWQGWRWHQEVENPAPLASQAAAVGSASAPVTRPGSASAATDAALSAKSQTAAQTTTSVTSTADADATTQPQPAGTGLAAAPAATVAPAAGITAVGAQPTTSTAHAINQAAAQAAAATHTAYPLAGHEHARRHPALSGKLVAIADSRLRHSATGKITRRSAIASASHTLQKQNSVTAKTDAASLGFSHSSAVVATHPTSSAGSRTKVFATSPAAAARHKRRRQWGHNGTTTSTVKNGASAASLALALSKNSHYQHAKGIIMPRSALPVAASATANTTTTGAIDPLALRLAALRFSPQGLPQSLGLLDTPPTPEPQPEPRFSGPRLLFTAVAAPDLSTVRFADVQLPELGYGLLVEYRLTPFLRLQTGLLHSTKTYRARRNDYDWSGAPNALRNNFDWVEGSCTILDLPITLRQDWLRRPTHTVFTAVGISSYLLQREHYSYDAISPSPAFTWQKDLSNENKTFFNVLNLSFGYERRLAARWSWQAEPYIKVPLTGIGFGKVQLLSGGVLVGVKYGL